MVMLARYGQSILVSSENQTMCHGEDRVSCENIGWIASGDDYLSQFNRSSQKEYRSESIDCEEQEPARKQIRVACAGI